MTATGIINILDSPLLRRRDLGDPLGVWAGRGTVIGDGGGGGTLAQFTVPGSRRGGHIYTVYGVGATGQAGPTVEADSLSVRLLTNWPPSDLAGINGASITRTRLAVNDGIFGASPVGSLIDASDRFVLLFDPRPDPNVGIVILEAWANINVLNETHTFEAWGYFWDRLAQDFPGGLRHPGGF